MQQWNCYVPLEDRKIHIVPLIHKSVSEGKNRLGFTQKQLKTILIHGIRVITVTDIITGEEGAGEEGRTLITIPSCPVVRQFVSHFSWSEYPGAGERGEKYKYPH